jgi:hypothetical protein
MNLLIFNHFFLLGFRLSFGGSGPLADSPVLESRRLVEQAG